MKDTCCPNCENNKIAHPTFFWREVSICDADTIKQRTTGTAIYCASCGRTISVIPKSLPDQNDE